MRLLQLKDDGALSLVEFSGKVPPQYAILSHTWGADDEEVTFKDLEKGTGKSKAGYRKLDFCANRAKRDNLQFFWVDTCCINKSSSAELSEAINSMFRWYQGAARCYVYLSDVSVDSSVRDDEFSQIWEPKFKRSKWFTRGWTLQELVAPTSVEFFSREGRQLGDKRLLEPIISEITGIATTALRGSPLSLFSVYERMSWAAKRQTKREEDAAYALLGIFDIHMSLIYGEGQQKALKRLLKKIKKPLESLIQEFEDLKQVVYQPKNRPKELGHSWETGAPEDKLKIDDGLNAEYFLPVGLCATPEVKSPLLSRPWLDTRYTQRVKLNFNTFRLSLNFLNTTTSPEGFPDYRKFSKATFCYGNGMNDMKFLTRIGHKL
jgi:hypothetical protein